MLSYLFTYCLKNNNNRVCPQYNEPHPTPLFVWKGQGFEIGNWDGMQPLHTTYDLITYLTCTIYSYNKI
jgi:hypothetical protein